MSSTSQKVWRVRLQEQIEGPNTITNYGVHHSLAPWWWNQFKDRVEKMHYDPMPFTREAYVEEEEKTGVKTKALGAWTQSKTSGQGFRLIAYPKRKKIEIIGTTLVDPRISAALLSSSKVLPEMNEYSVFLAMDGPGDENDKNLGTLRDLISSARSLKVKSKEWTHQKGSEPTYEEFKYEVLEDISDLKWYHATSLNNFKSIMSKGLLPSGTFNQGTGWTQLNLNLQKAVYLTADKDYALDIAEALVDQHEQPAIVLEVDGSALGDHSKLVVDEDSIINAYDGGVSGGLLLTDMPDFMTSVVNKIRSLGYEGQIPSSKLKPLDVVLQEDEEVYIYSFEEFKEKHMKENKTQKTWKLLLEQEDALPEPPDLGDAGGDEGGDLDLGDDDLGGADDLGGDMEGGDLEGGDDLGGDADLGDEGGDFDLGGGGDFGGGGGGGFDFGGGDDLGGDEGEGSEATAPAEVEEPADPVEHAVEEAKKLASGNQNIQQILTVMKSIITDRTIDAQQLTTIIQRLKGEDDLVLSAVANRLEMFTKGF